MKRLDHARPASCVLVGRRYFGYDIDCREFFRRWMMRRRAGDLLTGTVSGR